MKEKPNLVLANVCLMTGGDILKDSLTKTIYYSQEYFSKSWAGIYYKDWKESGKGIVSAIGHPATAQIFQKILGDSDIKSERINYRMEPGDEMLACQLRERVPFGEITDSAILEKIGYDFYLVRMNTLNVGSRLYDTETVSRLIYDLGLHVEKNGFSSDISSILEKFYSSSNMEVRDGILQSL